MKRKFLTLLLALLLGVTGLAACSVDTGTSTESSSSSVENSSPESSSPENSSPEDGTPEDGGEEHTHDYTVTKTDNLYHWTECECGEKSEKSAHNFETKKDSTHHWTECECGALDEKAAHDYTITEKDGTYHWTMCACGTIDEKSRHRYAVTKKDTTHHWNECTCGDTTEKIVHSYVGELQKDETHHWKVCSCEAMNKVLHNYTVNQKDNTYHWIACECGQIDEKITHSYSTQKKNYTYHWLECECGAISQREVHSFADDRCTNCSSKKPTSGLSYTRASGLGSYYIVTGIGTATDTDIVIPEKYQGRPVKAIREHAFSEYNDCKNLTSITIPDSVTTIGYNAFSNRNLKGVIFGENSAITIIEDGLFANCYGLTRFAPYPQSF